MKSPALGLILLVAALAPACSSVKGESYFSKTYDLASVQRMAVVDGNNPTYKAETRQTLVDGVQFEFFKKGWNVIERANIQKGIDELNFQNADLTSQSDRKKLGEILNVQALTIVNVGSQDDLTVITAKMFDIQTGELIWMGTGEGELNKGLGTVMGAAAGAVAGAVIGNQIGGNGTAGGVIGGVAGGAIGNSMSQSQLENAKDIVRKVCESIPPR